MLLIGLTGNIASGKSTVSREFAERGATVVDADLLARQAVREGTAAFSWCMSFWVRSRSSAAARRARACSVSSRR